MGILQKIKFWRRNNTPTKVVVCVPTEDPRTCDAATVTIEPTVMCDACTQTTTTMDGGGGGGGVISTQSDCAFVHLQETVRRLEDKNLKLSDLLEQYYNLVVLNKEVEQQLRNELSHTRCEQKRYEKENRALLRRVIQMENEIITFPEPRPPPTVRHNVDPQKKTRIQRFLAVLRHFIGPMK
jgi:hypothetical protein